MRHHNSIKSVAAFNGELRLRLPAVIRRMQTDNGFEFGTEFTRHLYDFGMTHRLIPRGFPASNGNVERRHRTGKKEVSRRVLLRGPQNLGHKFRTREPEYKHRRPYLALGGKTPALDEIE